MALSASIRHLRDYIAIPSVNPMGRTDIPDDVAGEQRYAEHLYEQLRGLGLDAKLVGEGNRLSVIATAEARGATETVGIASHLDTVPVDTMRIAPFDPVIEGDRLYGRGSCDTKGGMACLVAALERVLERGTLRRNIVVIGEADEEFGSFGVAEVVAGFGAMRPDWVIATEPTELALVTHHKGVTFATLEATGRACHASDPSLGRNAIVELSHAIVAIDRWSGVLAERTDPVLGPATLSIGRVSGGQSPNVVPDHAEVAIDRRLLPGEDAASFQRELEAVLAREGIKHVVVASCEEAKPPLATPAQTPAVQACQGALSGCKLPTQPGSVAFGTDAGLFEQRGIPGVVMGPGSIVQAHTEDEFVDVAQVDTMTDFFTQLLEGASPS